MAGAGCLATLVRWAFVIGLLYYGFNALSRVPEVQRVAGALLRGETVDLTPLADEVRAFLNLPSRRKASQPASSATPSPPPTPGPAASDDALIHQPGEVGITSPRVLVRVPARYTAEAQRQGIQGTVILRCIVEKDGSVSDATVTRSLDATYGLDQEAVNAVSQWRFEPGQRAGQPVRVGVMVTVTFTLRPAANGPSAR